MPQSGQAWLQGGGSNLPTQARRYTDGGNNLPTQERRYTDRGAIRLHKPGATRTDGATCLHKNGATQTEEQPAYESTETHKRVPNQKHCNFEETENASLWHRQIHLLSKTARFRKLDVQRSEGGAIRLPLSLSATTQSACDPCPHPLKSQLPPAPVPPEMQS